MKILAAVYWGLPLSYPLCFLFNLDLVFDEKILLHVSCNLIV